MVRLSTAAQGHCSTRAPASRAATTRSSAPLASSPDTPASAATGEPTRGGDPRPRSAGKRACRARVPDTPRDAGRCASCGNLGARPLLDDRSIPATPNASGNDGTRLALACALREMEKRPRRPRTRLLFVIAVAQSGREPALQCPSAALKTEHSGQASEPPPGGSQCSRRRRCRETQIQRRRRTSCGGSLPRTLVSTGTLVCTVARGAAGSTTSSSTMVAQRMSRSAPSPPRSSALARRPFLRCCTLVDAWGLWVRVVPSRAPGESGLAARRGHGGAARAGVAALTLGALGVVFGDSGLSASLALTR